MIATVAEVSWLLSGAKLKVDSLLPSSLTSLEVSHPTVSQFDPNTLLAMEKEISNGLEFHYSELKPDLKDLSLPGVDPSHDMNLGTDDALLKWR